MVGAWHHESFVLAGLSAFEVGGRGERPDGGAWLATTLSAQVDTVGVLPPLQLSPSLPFISFQPHNVITHPACLVGSWNVEQLDNLVGRRARLPYCYGGCCVSPFCKSDSGRSKSERREGCESHEAKLVASFTPVSPPVTTL